MESGEFTKEEMFDIISKNHILSRSGTTVLLLDEEARVHYVNEENISLKKLPCPGDLLRCINALSCAGGCGCHDNCSSCKLRQTATRSILTQETLEGDASLLLEGNEEKDYHVLSVPFIHKGKRYAIVSLIDVTMRKRELMMERMFFHDIINLSGAVQGFLDCVDEENALELLTIVKDLSKQVVEEINTQRDLIYAQKGILKSNMTKFAVSELLNYTFESLTPMVEKKGMTLVLEDLSEGKEVFSDHNLIHRVLLNMIKNASETEHPGTAITLRAQLLEQEVIFSVHNEGAIPAEIKADIFKYGNTSKGEGHGIGTYSVKMIGENYLHGKVWFESTEEEGTEFFLALPLWQEEK